jgi:AcrR family transcriptional regulator
VTDVTSETDVPPASASRWPARDDTPRRARHEEVLNAALRVFAAKGYRAATIEDIATELGFTPAAIYYYVKGKKALLNQIVFQPVESLMVEGERIASLDRPAPEKLAELIRSHLRVMIERREWFAVMLREQVELPAERLAELRERERAYRDLIEGMIRDGVRAGTLITGHPNIVSLMIIGTLNWTLHWFQPGGPLGPESDSRLHPEKMADVFTRSLLHGLLPR